MKTKLTTYNIYLEMIHTLNVFIFHISLDGVADKNLENKANTAKKVFIF